MQALTAAALNDIAHFDCEPCKLTPHKYRDEERYYKADSDESEEDDEEDTDEDLELIGDI
jgi:hypothetical protein